MSVVMLFAKPLDDYTSSRSVGPRTSKSVGTRRRGKEGAKGENFVHVYETSLVDTLGFFSALSVERFSKNRKVAWTRTQRLLGGVGLEDVDGNGGLGLLGVDEEAGNGALGVELDETGNVGAVVVLGGKEPASKDDSADALVLSGDLIGVDGNTADERATILEGVNSAEEAQFAVSDGEGGLVTRVDDVVLSVYRLDNLPVQQVLLLGLVVHAIDTSGLGDQTLSGDVQDGLGTSNVGGASLNALRLQFNASNGCRGESEPKCEHIAANKSQGRDQWKGGPSSASKRDGQPRGSFFATQKGGPTKGTTVFLGGRVA